MQTKTTELLDCGHPPTSTESAFTNGTARHADGTTLCYACADSEQAAQVATSTPGDSITLYVNSAGTAITTWPGGVLMTRVQWGKAHHWSNERRYLTAVDVDGRTWSGTGANGMWATLRLTKS